MDHNSGVRKIICPDDSNFEAITSRWLQEVDEEDCSDDNCDEDVAVHSDHSTPEQDEVNTINNVSDNKDSTSCQTQHSVQNYYGKNTCQWAANPFTSRTRTQKHNIIMQLPGLRGPACVDIEADAETVWNLTINYEITQIILKWTNVKLGRQRATKDNANVTDIRDLDMTELKAFIGLVLYSAVFKSNQESTRTLSATNNKGRNIFWWVMSRHQFEILLANLQFDNLDDRNESKNIRLDAPIREIFDKFVTNSSCYIASDLVLA
ncbi:hypothetical protein PR048_007621 [Dryococelus australis]|uniref:PiggyBac transposable element-derived protein domain-containing protein n=1 Tax=Dryococelus australis TaxID=614101 RepID=A0ABQ9HUR0_9NEOP|nr:hypothetical protein PR048_007621 [Dryococelus australis]